MGDLISRGPYFGYRLEQQRHPFDIARKRVEGGAPYLHEHGVPGYLADKWDTAETHPACALLM